MHHSSEASYAYLSERYFPLLATPGFKNWKLFLERSRIGSSCVGHVIVLETLCLGHHITRPNNTPCKNQISTLTEVCRQVPKGQIPKANPKGPSTQESRYFSVKATPNRLRRLQDTATLGYGDVGYGNSRLRRPRLWRLQVTLTPLFFETKFSY